MRGEVGWPMRPFTLLIEGKGIIRHILIMATALVSAYWLRRRFVEGLNNIRIIDGKEKIPGPYR